MHSLDRKSLSSPLGEMPPSDTWRLKAVMPNGTSIPFKLVDGGPKGSIEEDAGEMTEQYIIEAKRLLEFLCYSFSKIQAWPGLNPWVYRPPKAYVDDIHRTMANDCVVGGAADPDYQYALKGMVTKKIAFEPYPVGRPGDPFSTDEGLVPGQTPGSTGATPELPDDTYAQYVLLTITYGPGKATYANETGSQHDLLEITANASGEFILNSPNEELDWAGKDEILVNHVIGKCKEANVALSKVVPGVEWVVKFKRVPFENMHAIAELLVGLLGKVNSATIPILNGAEAETVLFMGFNYNMMFSWRSKYAFSELDLKFAQRRIYTGDFADTAEYAAHNIVGWNHFWSPEHHRWLLLWDNLSRPMYVSADLNAEIFGGQGVWA